MYYEPIIFMYVLLFVAVSVIGIVAVIIIHCWTVNKAERIAREIARYRAGRIEYNTMYDVDAEDYDSSYDDWDQQRSEW